jgi:pimeloyl-ACP methyl ester carboxylesterase
VLVAHSLAGLAAPLVAAAAPVRRVVYLAAMLPEPGRSVDDLATAGRRMTRRGIGRGQVTNHDGSTSFQPAAAVELFYPDSPPERAARAAARLRRQHWRITAEPSPVPTRTGTPATYVLCTEDRIIDTDWARAAVPDLVELPGDHCPFLARPAELADLLVSV